MSCSFGLEPGRGPTILLPSVCILTGNPHNIYYITHTAWRWSISHLILILDNKLRKEPLKLEKVYCHIWWNHLSINNIWYVCSALRSPKHLIWGISMSYLMDCPLSFRDSQSIKRDCIGISPVSSIFSLSFIMKHIDVLPHYFFLIVIIDKPNLYISC